MSEIVIKMAQVESVIDDADGLRIKARLSQDGNVSTNDLPYSFPLLPKTFQSVPKVGEGVLIFCSELSNNYSNRYYIGPIISQPQFNSYDPYMYGRGTSISLLQGSSVEPLEKISNYDSTRGAYPKVNDVALVGRDTEDIVLKDGEIDLRCGIRTNTSDNENLLGDVIFNSHNPSYIQLKYKRGLTHSMGREADSIINVVADKINLISHKDRNYFNLTDKDELIKESDMDMIMSKLHQLPYGDILVEVLDKMRSAITNHVHAYPGLPPCLDQYITALHATNLKEILSDNVRIS
ncbi:MAG: hypothetical protein IKT40_02690 [Bacilli bacterium]|nr:hypothetical protein [Bacilli bacterium]